MANKRIIELQERTSIDMGDWLIVDSSTSTRKLSLATLFNYMTLTSMIFVTELPTTDISESTIYLVPHSGSTTDWDEYIYRDNEWIQIGTSTIDLSAIYQSKTDNNLQTTSKQIVGAINEVKSALGKKVDYLSNSNYIELNTTVPYNSSYTAPVSATYLIKVSGDLNGAPKIYIDSGRTKEISSYYADSNTYDITLKFPLKQGTTIYTRNNSSTHYVVMGYYVG